MFLRKIEQYKKEKMPIAYVDESGFAHSMPRTHGYSRMGKRMVLVTGMLEVVKM